MNKYLLVFIFNCAILFGSAYNVNRYFNFEHSSDSKSYIKMSNNDYNVTITHKYRFVIPLIVKQLTDISSKLNLNADRTQMVFFLFINTFLMAFSGLFIFKTISNFGFSFLIALVSILPFLTSRWAVFATALPLVESLFIYAICGFLYAISAKKYYLALFFMVLGPIAKESFWLYIPLIFLFSEKPKVIFSIFMLMFSISLFLSIRFYIDYLYPNSNSNGFSNAINHVEMIRFSISRLFSIKGIGELFFVFGWFNLIIITGIYVSKIKYLKLETLKIWIILFICGITLAQMLLSGDIDRMFFLISPLYCVGFAFFFSKIIETQKYLVQE